MTVQSAADPTIRLPRDVYYILVHNVRATLPPPPTDAPDDLVRRDNAAIAEVVSMLPANAEEATLAARCVAANAGAMHALAEARAAADAGDMVWQQKCTAQSVSLMREARGARSLLLRLETARERREKDHVACERVAWNEHCLIGLMQNGLAEAQTQPPVAEAPLAACNSEEPALDPVAEAECYAVIYPDRARNVRRSGGIPPGSRFGPPGPAIVNGTTSRLRALDTA